MRWCKTCRDYMLFPESHKCPPMFIVLEDGRDDPVEVYAISESAAAQKFCKQSDCEGDYGIISSGGTTLKVTNPRTNEVSEWDVLAESVPSYSAYRKAP